MVGLRIENNSKKKTALGTGELVNAVTINGVIFDGMALCEWGWFLMGVGERPESEKGLVKVGESV